MCLALKINDALLAVVLEAFSCCLIKEYYCITILVQFDLQCLEQSVLNSFFCLLIGGKNHLKHDVITFW